jgi:sugar/nucleoside kinase (ribokinase family)
MLDFNKKILFKEKGNDLLTIGEVLIDMVSEDYSDNFECDTYNKFFGGAPANIAINTNRLGINSIIATSVGKDGLGEFLIKKLKDSKIYTKCVKQVDYPTSLVLITKSTGTPVPIFYRGADYHIDYTPELEVAIKDSKIIHFSCWPISMEHSRKSIEKIIEVAKKENIMICFDPNYHPMVWEKGHDGIKYIKELIGKVDIIKPSEDDAERLFGKDTPENQIDKFLNLGAKFVIMTLGKDGAIVSNGAEKISFKTLATEVVDTTGAGDAFWSGFYAGIIRGYTIKEALDFGFAVSAYKLKFVGAVVNLPTIEEIKKMYNL